MPIINKYNEVSWIIFLLVDIFVVFLQKILTYSLVFFKVIYEDDINL